MQTKADNPCLEPDDLVFVSNGERSGFAVLSDVFEEEVLVNMLDRHSSKLTVSRDDIKRVQTHPVLC